MYTYIMSAERDGSDGGESCRRRGQAVDVANGRETAVVAHGEGEDAPRVGIQRVEGATVRTQSLVPHALCAEDCRPRDRIDQLQRAVLADRVAGDRPVAEVRDED